MKGRGVLFIVSTPIGNLEDITLRALRVLKEVELIAAEDTRRTRKLLGHYQISTPITSYFEQNELKKGPYIIAMLKEGKDVALVSDAGTPGISDPGYRLVKLALKSSVEVTPIPGPSALISALAVSGLPTDSFAFYGFPPRRPRERRLFLARLRWVGKTSILYESPRRVVPTLKDILTVLGEIEVVVVRELTKIHEEIIRGKVPDVIERLKDRSIKGEVTLVIERLKMVKEEIPLLEEIKRCQNRLGLPIRDIIKLIAEERGIPKGEVYKESLKLKGEK